MVPMELTARLPVIGVVRSTHQELETTPIQASLARADHGIIEIAEPYRDGLEGLADFDYAWLLSWLDRPRDPDGDAPMRQVPFLLRRQQRAMGIFATRGPRRVNPIGLSLIQLLEVTSQAVEFAGVDLLDGTPVLDLKPYVTRFDQPPGDPRCGWFDQLTIKDGTTPEQLARPESAP
jgi:tRNA (adenine37-N6)-methyltransferase